MSLTQYCTESDKQHGGLGTEWLYVYRVRVVCSRDHLADWELLPSITREHRPTYP